MNQILSHITASVIGMVILIVFKPVRDWFYSNNTGQCVYKRPIIGGEKDIHEVIIRKRFGKNVSVNCPWFKIRKIETRNDKEYFHCPFGYNGDTENYDSRGGECRFVRNKNTRRIKNAKKRKSNQSN